MIYRREIYVKIISTGGSSQKYGNCERCGKYCAEVFDLFGFDGKNDRDLFGCLECCITVRNEMFPWLKGAKK